MDKFEVSPIKKINDKLEFKENFIIVSSSFDKSKSSYKDIIDMSLETSQISSNELIKD